MLIKTKNRRRTLALSIIPACVLGFTMQTPAIAQSAAALVLPVRKDMSQSDLPTGLLDKRRPIGSGTDETPSPEKSPAPEGASLPPVSQAESRRETGGEKPKTSSRKPAASRSAAASTDSGSRTKPTANSNNVSDADLALVAHLRPGISNAVNEEAKPRTDLVSASPMNTRQARSAAMPATAPAAEPGDADPDSAETSEENAEELFSSEAAAAAAAAPPPAMVSAPLQPNLYIPQSAPERSRGLFSRLFNRRSNNNETAPARSMQQPATHFNSDYATRSGDAIMPAVLYGNGLNGTDLPIGGEDAYRLTNSLPNDYRPTDLVCLPEGYCFYGNPLYLRSEAANALCQMINAAAAEGLTIRVVSAYRDFNHQNRLYTRAVARYGPDQKRVARPGRSEHFLGTTVDVTNNAQHVLKRSFGDTAEGRWLAANAGRFGYKLTVMPQNGRSPNAEPWHLRYMGSGLNQPSGRSIVANPNSGRQRRDVFGSIGRALGLRR